MAVDLDESSKVFRVSYEYSHGIRRARELEARAPQRPSSLSIGFFVYYCRVLPYKDDNLENPDFCTLDTINR